MRTVLIALLICLSFVAPAYAVDWCTNANTELCLTFEEGVTTVDDRSANNFSISKFNAATQSSAQNPTIGSTSTYSGIFPNSSTEDYMTFDDAGGVIDYEGATEDFSVCYWFWSSLDSTLRHMGIVDGNDDGWNMLQFGGTAVWHQLNGKDTKSANGAVVDSTWKHVCAVLDRDGNGQMWSDGSTSGSTTGLASEAMDITSTIFTIGGISSAGQFNGHLDEIIIYTGLLDSTDINDIMDNGLVQVAAGPLVGAVMGTVIF